MKKIARNMATVESRAFWETAERSALEALQWPAWKRAGINVAQLREKPREKLLLCDHGLPPTIPPCDYGGTNHKDYKDYCINEATLYLKFNYVKNVAIYVTAGYFIIPYCDIHAAGFDHIQRVSKEEYEEYINNYLLEDEDGAPYPTLESKSK